MARKTLLLDENPGMREMQKKSIMRFLKSDLDAQFIESNHDYALYRSQICTFAIDNQRLYIESESPNLDKIQERIRSRYDLKES